MCDGTVSAMIYFLRVYVLNLNLQCVYVQVEFSMARAHIIIPVCLHHSLFVKNLDDSSRFFSFYTCKKFNIGFVLFFRSDVNFAATFLSSDSILSHMSLSSNSR